MALQFAAMSHTVTVTFSLGICLACLCAQAAADEADERLWREIAALRNERPQDAPSASSSNESENAPVSTARVREALIRSARMYQTLYPGGARAVDALLTEMEALFELACLSGGDFSPLQNRVMELEKSSRPSDRCEAAYWRILLDAALSPGGSIEQSRRDFIERCPDSPRARRMAHALADPDETPAAPSGGVREIALPPALADGSRIEIREGQPLMALVWMADDEGREALRELGERSLANRELPIVAISVDLSPSRTRQAFDTLGLPWPLAHDPLGLAGAFAQRWEIRRTPTLLLFNNAGELVDRAENAQWRELAQRAILATPQTGGR